MFGVLGRSYALPMPADPSFRPRAVLFDRDGTLVRDVPYNADPELVEPVPGVQVLPMSCSTSYILARLPWGNEI